MKISLPKVTTNKGKYPNWCKIVGFDSIREKVSRFNYLKLTTTTTTTTTTINTSVARNMWDDIQNVKTTHKKTKLKSKKIMAFYILL
jgi:hypothetical protein